MGQTISHAASTPSAPPPPPSPSPSSPLPPPLGIPPPPAAATPAKPEAAVEEKTDYLNLPCPVKYEEIQREAMMSLKPENFEGLRFDVTKPINQSFSLHHSVMMGNMEVPSQSSQVLKIPNSTYEFGATVFDAKRLLLARILSDGRLSARVSQQLTDNVALKINANLTNEPHFSQGMFSFDIKGHDWQSQLQFGNNAFYGVNYFQSVTKSLALGGEGFWLGHQRKSGVGVAARYQTEKAIATAQLASTGVVALTYVQRVSEKAALATEMMYNWNSREATTTVGYDYFLRQCRLRGRFDTNGVVSAYIEEQLNLGLKLVLSAEVDHWKKDYKFGFGLTIGEI